MSERPVLPDFELPATGNQRFQLSAYPAPFVLYFYPRDDTPGCTVEGQDFRDRVAAQWLGKELVVRPVDENVIFQLQVPDRGTITGSVGAKCLGGARW